MGPSRASLSIPPSSLAPAVLTCFWPLLEAALDYLMTPGETILSPLSQEEEEEMGVGSRRETSFLRNCCPRAAGSCVLGCPRASCSSGTGICKVSPCSAKFSQDPGEEALLAKGQGTTSHAL